MKDLISYDLMTKTKYWLSLLAISVVLVAGSLAVSPIAFAGNDDDEVEASIEAELELEQDGSNVDVEMEAERLASNADFTVRAYKDDITNCEKGAGNALAAFTDESDGDGDFEISGTITGKDVGDVGSVSIRADDGTGAPGPIVVCFRDTTP